LLRGEKQDAELPEMSLYFSAWSFASDACYIITLCLNYSVLVHSAVICLRFTVTGFYSRRFLARSQNCEKRLLASSCLSTLLSVHPPVCLHGNSALTGRILMKFDICLVFEKLSQNSSFIKIGQEQRLPYKKTTRNF